MSVQVLSVFLYQCLRLRRTAVFSFEGIGLVIPITDAMKEPRKFPKAITGVMFFLTGA